MTRTMQALSVLIVLLVAGLSTGCASTGGAAASPPPPPPPPAAVGTWNLTIETPIGTQEPFLSITGSEGALAGTMSGEGGDVPLSGVEFMDGTLKFSATIDAQGQEIELDFEGTVDGDSIDGVFNTVFGAMPTTGARSDT